MGLTGPERATLNLVLLLLILLMSLNLVVVLGDVNVSFSCFW